MSSFCPHCGSPISDSDKFCPACGGSLAELRKVQQAAPAPQNAPAGQVPAQQAAPQPVIMPAQPAMQPAQAMQSTQVMPTQNNGLEEGEIAYDMALAAQFGVQQPNIAMPANSIPNSQVFNAAMSGTPMGMPAPNTGMPVNPAPNPAMPYTAPVNGMPPQMGMAQPYGAYQMPYPQVKKHSPLSQTAGILSFLAAPISLILAIIDLAKKDETQKHSLSVAAVVIDTIKIIFWIWAFLST